MKKRNFLVVGLILGGVLLLIISFAAIGPRTYMKPQDLTRIPPPRPDLAIKNIVWTPGTAGVSVTVKNLVYNFPPSGIAYPPIRVQLLYPGGGVINLRSSVINEAIPVDGERVVTFGDVMLISTSIPTKANVDPFNDIIEINENNNEKELYTSGT